MTNFVRNTIALFNSNWFVIHWGLYKRPEYRFKCLVFPWREFLKSDNLHINYWSKRISSKTISLAALCDRSTKVSACEYQRECLEMRYAKTVCIMLGAYLTANNTVDALQFPIICGILLPIMYTYNVCFCGRKGIQIKFIMKSLVLKIFRSHNIWKCYHFVFEYLVVSKEIIFLKICYKNKKYNLN